MALAVAHWLRAPPQIIALNPHGFGAAYLIPADRTQVHITAIVPFSEMDNQGTLGLAHYTEHLAWLGAFGDAPAANRHTNAYTTIDHIAYLAQSPSGEVHGAIARLAAVAAPITLAPDFAAEEAQIIAREYEFAVVDDPYYRLMEAFNARHYGPVGYARSLIGTPESIAALTLDEARTWHSATHQRSSMTVLIVGDISADYAEDMLSTVLDLPNAAQASIPAPRPPLDLALRDVGINRSTSDVLTQPQLFWGRIADVATNATPAEAQAQTDLLYYVLDSTLEGSLAGPLRFDARIAQGYDFYLGLVTPAQVEMTLLAARPDEAVTLDALYSAIEETLAGIAAKGVPEASFARIQTRLLRDIDEGDAADWTADFALTQIAQRRAPFDLANYRDAVERATAADLTLWLRALAAAPSVAEMVAPAAPQTAP
jgi:predicted Zn-dependent peptidase